MTLLIQGYYHDVWTDSQGRTRWDSGWHPNRVVHTCSLLLAALLKREEGMQGILYWAVGEGERGWDTLCPSPQLDDTQLAAEVARQALIPEQIVYLDDAGVPSGSPTACLEVTAEFAGEDLVSSGFQSLREFGLFGGNATDALDSGLMIDYVIHPRIDLTPGDTLTRRLRLTSAASTAQQIEALAGFGADLPVSSLDGVGDAYTRALNEHGIHSLGDLATIDPLRPVGNIPPVKLQEFRAKARLVMRLQVSPSHLQEAMGDLQIALDDALLRRITLET